MGRNFARYLTEENIDYTVVDLKPPYRVDKWKKGDVTRKETFEEDYEVDGIAHLSAIPGHKQCKENPERAEEVNIGGTKNALEYCRRHDVPLTLASTCGIYAFDTVYTRTKEKAEELTRKYAEEYDLPNVILRFANVYGPMFGDKSSIIPIFIRKARNGEPLTIEGDGEQRRDFVYAGDVARTILASLSYDSSDTFDVGTGTTVSINELANIFRSIFDDLEVRRISLPDYRDDDHVQIEISPEKTFKELELNDFLSVREGVKRIAKTHTN